MTLSKIMRAGIAAFALAAAAMLSPAPAAAQAPAKVTIVIFGFPSLGAFMPPIIKAEKLDAKHGLDIEFVERPPDAYTTQFNSGEFKVGGSAAVLTVGLADARGVKVKYLFNLFDYWGTVVTSRPEIKSVKDLEGKQLAAAAATTNFVMFEFFAKQLGVDKSKLQIVNTATPGLVGYALADRADADPALGAGLYAVEGQEAGHPHARHRHGQDLDQVRRRRAHPLSWRSPRMTTGSSRTRR